MQAWNLAIISIREVWYTTTTFVNVGKYRIKRALNVRFSFSAKWEITYSHSHIKEANKKKENKKKRKQKDKEAEKKTGINKKSYMANKCYLILLLFE